MKSEEKQPVIQDSQAQEKSTKQKYKESRLAQKRLNILLNFLPDPVFAINIDNKVEFINPAFERTFGWTLEEVKGENIKFIPDHLIEQAKQGTRLLYENQAVLDFETQRYTKDGRILDILINGSILYDEHNQPAGQALILRDMTVEKRMAKSNQIMFKISKALHHYQKLGDLIAVINEEIKKLLSVEGAFILMADTHKDQLYFYSANYRDIESEKKFKKIRFSADQGVSGQVYKTGNPLIISDVNKCSFFLRRVDDETDLVTRNILSVPIKLKDNTIGVFVVVNKNYGNFDDTDSELLSMVASTIALPIENTRIHEELRKSYKELKTLNHAKTKVINHLAHELKTPVSVLSASMVLLSKKLNAAGFENDAIKRILTRGQKNLNRILDIQYEVEDLLRKKDFKAYNLLTKLLDACKDELITLIESQTENKDIIDKVHETIKSIFGPNKIESKTIRLDEYLKKQIEKLHPKYKHRNCKLTLKMDKNNSVYIPMQILDTIITGIIRNAFEYTPDGSKIEVSLKNKN
ncbi:MAG: PAS domain S-box protein, partial [Desulfobacteraceae bacterium]|nr:PAS domain S-box protein [Desulfobacteraceae bacterium]